MSMGNVVGPISSAELRDRAAHGQIDADTMVAKDVPENWVRADRVTGLVGDKRAGESGAGQASSDALDATDKSSPAPGPMLSGIGSSANRPAVKADAHKFEYKVLTQRDKSFNGKFDLEKLEETLNLQGQQGWRVAAALVGSIHGITSANREELVIFLER